MASVSASAAAGAVQADAPAWIDWPAERAAPASAWWRAFSDPVLDELESRAAHGNVDLAVAAARLEEARAAAADAGSARLPRAGVSAGATRQGGPLVNAAGDQGGLYSAGAALTYEADLSGRLALLARGARLDADAESALREFARVNVEAQVASRYLSLRGLEAELSLVRRMAAAQRESLELTERRHGAGAVSDLDVARAQSEAAAIDADELAVERQLALARNALALVVGEAPAGFGLPPSQSALVIPVAPAVIDSARLGWRPDIVAARRAWLAAQAREGAARRAWFPQLVLNAGGGYAAPALASLFSAPMQAWNLGALLAAPLLDGGHRRAVREQMQARESLALAQYRGTVLHGLRDVADSLDSLQLLAREVQLHDAAVAAAVQATRLSESRYRSGLGSQLELLDASRSELRRQRDALQVRLAQQQATVGLVRALGGDWLAEP
jgi:multidrug efflux system outer membrane protein